MPEMDWEEKYKRSEELIIILKMNMTEQEMLQRAAQDQSTNDLDGEYANAVFQTKDILY